MTDGQMLLLAGQLEDLQKAVNALRTDALRMRQQVEKHGRLLNSPRLWRESLDSNGDLVETRLRHVMNSLQRLEESRER